jgi:hypothetical protein
MESDGRAPTLLRKPAISTPEPSLAASLRFGTMR